MKNKIKLNEKQFNKFVKQIVKESVIRILNENEKQSEIDSSWDEFDAAKDKKMMGFKRSELFDPKDNPNITDQSKKRHPYYNYLSRNTKRYLSPEDEKRLRTPEYGGGFNGSDEYYNIYDEEF